MRYPREYIATEDEAWRDIARDVLRDATGTEPDGLTGHWTLGTTFVWSGGGFCVKASADHDVRCEAWACETARAAAVPAPEVVAQGTDERLPGGRWFVMRFIEGTDAATDPESLRVVGATLRTLHTVELDRFGPHDQPAADWRVWLEQRIDEAGAIVSDPGVADLVADADLDGVPCRLVHGDPQLGHFRMLETRLSGVIDFADAMGGDPAWDFARLFSGVGDPESAALVERALPTVLEAYGAVDLSRLRTYRCVVALTEYASNVWHDWPEWIEPSRTVLVKRLEEATP